MNPGAIHDFDFLLGHWQVTNHRLRKRLQDNHEWETFEATQHNQRLPGGIGNFDDFVAETWRPGFVGLSLRLLIRRPGSGAFTGWTIPPQASMRPGCCCRRW